MSGNSNDGWRHYDAARARSYAACRRLIGRISAQRGAVIGVASGALCEAVLAEASVRRLFAVVTGNFQEETPLSSAGSRSRHPKQPMSALQRLEAFADRCQLLYPNQLQPADLPGDLEFCCLNADAMPGSVGTELWSWGSRLRDDGVVLLLAHDQEAVSEVEREGATLARRFQWQVHIEGGHLWWFEKSALPISFIVPAYNCAKVIAQAVDSIFPANFGPDDELVVIDDASTDQTRQAVEHLKRKYPALQLVSHGVNKGTAAAARNTGIERTSNPIIFCLDADNILAPGTVGPLARHLFASGADAAAFGEIHYFRSSPNRVTHKWIYRERISLADALAGVVWPGPSGNYMFTRESWIRAGRYHEPSLENRSLDSWAFGIRQLGTGSSMVSLPGTWYFHRYGHESHYVRNWQVGSQSLAGLIGLIPFLELLQPEAVEYIFSPEGRTGWYEKIAEHPLKVRHAPPGVDGTVEYLPRYRHEQRREKLTSVARKVRSRLKR